MRKLKVAIALMAVLALLAAACGDGDDDADAAAADAAAAAAQAEAAAAEAAAADAEAAAEAAAAEAAAAEAELAEAQAELEATRAAAEAGDEEAQAALAAAEEEAAAQAAAAEEAAAAAEEAEMAAMEAQKALEESMMVTAPEIREAEVAMGFNACCADAAFWQIPLELGWWDDLNITIVPNSPTYHFFTASADAIAWLRSGEGAVAPGWVPGLFGALETFAQDIPPIFFADIYVGYAILVAPDSDSKTVMELVEEGMDFADAAQAAVQQLVGADIHIPPHSTQQAQYTNAF
ncbi:MAG: hypothetical protein OXH26_02910, partial [bacterium]|nr:hypothetical protein [bacterium]MDE0674183.1 hypothetical protein [bacterium]